MKEGQVSKDLKSIKNKEATELGVKDFFTSRDKKSRGSSGLVSDAEKILNEESSVKEALYLKSMEVEDMPNTFPFSVTSIFPFSS